MYQISESDYNEFLKYKQAKQAKEDKKLQKAKKLQDECENTFNEIQSLIIPDENSDLIYERNKFIKKYIKNKNYGVDKYDLKDLKSFNEYLLKELDIRSKLPEKSKEEYVYDEVLKEHGYIRRGSFNSYIKNKIHSDIEDFTDDYMCKLSYRDVKENIYDIIKNRYDYSEKDAYLYYVEKFAAKMKEKYSSYFDQN